jgi:hypothetical protein
VRHPRRYLVLVLGLAQLRPVLAGLVLGPVVVGPVVLGLVEVRFLHLFIIARARG